jgi:hypothetical protein
MPWDIARLWPKSALRHLHSRPLAFASRYKRLTCFQRVAPLRQSTPGGIRTVTRRYPFRSSSRENPE